MFEFDGDDFNEGVALEDFELGAGAQAVSDADTAELAMESVEISPDEVGVFGQTHEEVGVLEGVSLEARRELVDDILELRMKDDDILRKMHDEPDPVVRMKLDIQHKGNQMAMDGKLEAFYADAARNADKAIKNAENLLATL